jgi:hypothetical protein
VGVALAALAAGVVRARRQLDEEGIYDGVWIDPERV